MLQKFCVPQLSAAANMQQVIFQQNGFPAHYSSEVRALLYEQLPQCLIGLHGPIEWTLRLPALTPCDFFLWIASSRKSMEQGLGISQHVKNALETHMHQCLPKFFHMLVRHA